MTTIEILEVLNKMKKAWQDSFDIEQCFSSWRKEIRSDLFSAIYMNQLNRKNTELGFCSYLFTVENCKYGKFVMEQLNIDRVSNILFHGGFYDFPVQFENISEIKQKCLKPRLDHLIRTITRLENQLKSESHATTK